MKLAARLTKWNIIIKPSSERPSDTESKKAPSRKKDTASAVPAEVAPPTLSAVMAQKQDVVEEQDEATPLDILEDLMEQVRLGFCYVELGCEGYESMHSS